MSPRRWSLPLVAFGLTASLLASCGDTQATAPVAEPPPQLGAAPNIVSRDDIRKEPAGSPERMVLIWAQAVQFSDPDTVLRTYRPDARRRARLIGRAVRGIGPSLGRPEFVETTLFGPDRARVRAYLVSYDPERRPTARQPVTFNLVRRGESWFLRDPVLLFDTYRDVRLIRESATRESPRREGDGAGG